MYDAFCLGINIACFFHLFLYTDEDHIGRNVCIKICTEIRSDYHPLLREGPMFEAMIMNKELSNPLFQ